MNTYKKYCPNVFVAKCDKQYNKGDEITLTTRRGLEVKNIVYNLVMEANGFFFYSIVRSDGFNVQVRAKKKNEKINSYDFLKLGEPIKVGHHSEKRHRNLIERNWNRMEKAMECYNKADSYQDRLKYWESVLGKIDLSMPESLEYFTNKLEEAKMYHKGLKDGTIKREHSYALTYAKKEVNQLD